MPPHSPQLTGASTSWLNATYRRDPVNHWITVADRGGRLVRVESTVAGAPSFKYQRFDALRRRTYVRSSQGNWTYRYSANGHLGSAQNSGGPDFFYDIDEIGCRSAFMSSGGMGPSGNASNALNQPSGSFGGSGFDLRLGIDGATGSTFFFSDARNPDQPINPSVWADYTFSLDQSNGGVDQYTFQKNLDQFPYGGWYQWAIKGVLPNQGDQHLGAHKDAVSVVDGLTWINPTYGSYSHDADGNRESAPGWQSTFDGRNRLVEAITEGYATNPTGKKLEFEYDAEGRRVQKTVTTKTYQYGGSATSTATVHFVWDGWNLLYECHQDDQNAVVLERRYVWGADLSGNIGGAGGAGGLLA